MEEPTKDVKKKQPVKQEKREWWTGDGSMWKTPCGVFLFGGQWDKQQSISRMGDGRGCAGGLWVEKVCNSCGQHTTSSLITTVVLWQFN